LTASITVRIQGSKHVDEKGVRPAISGVNGSCAVSCTREVPLRSNCRVGSGLFAGLAAHCGGRNLRAELTAVEASAVAFSRSEARQSTVTVSPRRAEWTTSLAGEIGDSGCNSGGLTDICRALAVRPGVVISASAARRSATDPAVRAACRK